MSEEAATANKPEELDLVAAMGYYQDQYDLNDSRPYCASRLTSEYQSIYFGKVISEALR